MQAPPRPSTDPLAHLRAREGTTLLGKWRIDSLLGVGGSAAVYSATHRAGRRVAIKIAHPGPLMNPSELERFRREPYLANRVGHPAVVKVFDDGTTEDGLPFFVMELLEGEPLGAGVQRGEPRTVGEVVTIVATFLSVLEAAHAQGIVHRDLKPSNFFLCSNGDLKLLDFGIARTRDLDELTQSGMMLGTPAFMSPEQALARRDLVGPQTDIFAVGASAFVLLKAGPLREGNELALAAIEPLPSAEDMGLRGPREIFRVFERAVSFHVDARYPTAAEMRADLERAVRATSPDELARTAYDPSRPPSASNVPTLREARSFADIPPHGAASPPTQAFVLERRVPDGQPASSPHGPASGVYERPKGRDTSFSVARWAALVLVFVVAALGVRWVVLHRHLTKP
jgi:serine/threonine protein kinase